MIESSAASAKTTQVLFLLLRDKPPLISEKNIETPGTRERAARLLGVEAGKATARSLIADW